MSKFEIVRFQSDEIQAVREGEQVWVSVKRVCENLGIADQVQARKLKAKRWATTTLVVAVAEDGKNRESFCLALDSVPMWLSGIDERKVAPELRDKLVAYQCECRDALARHFYGAKQVDSSTSGAAMAQMAAAITVLAQGFTMLQAQVATLVEQRTIALTLVQPRDAEELCRRLAFSALQAFRAGLFKSERSARTSYESRIRRACGWSRYRGARLEEMPLTAWPYAKVEMSEIEADVKRAQDGRQLSLIKTG